MSFPPHDEIRITRLATGYLTELCKDGEVHTKLFDALDGGPMAKTTVAKLLNLMVQRKS